MKKLGNVNFTFLFGVLAATGTGGYLLYLLYQKYQLSQLSVEQRIEIERDMICAEGQRLGQLKEDAITQQTQLGPDYAIQLLQLIQTIALHDITYRAQYGADCTKHRRANLGNLALTARLFRDMANLIAYHPEQQYQAPNNLHGYIGTNIFDNLTFLTFFNICRATNPLVRQMEMTDKEVSTLLDSICSEFQSIASAEILDFQTRFQHFSSPTHNVSALKTRFFNLLTPSPDLVALRNQYRDPRSLIVLFCFTSFHREKTHIASAIQAIDNCLNLNFGHPLTAAQILANKRALFRALVIIGEAFTQTNLTPPSRNLTNLSNTDYQLFKKLRDRLADSEFDIFRNNAENFLQNPHNDFNNLLADLALLRPLLQNLLQQLTQSQQNNQLTVHYTSNAQPPAQHLPAGGNNHVERFQHMRVLLTVFPNNPNDAYRDDKRDNSHAFTCVAVTEKTNAEITEIRNIVANIPGKSTLDDPHQENKILVAGNDAQLLLVLLENYPNSDLTQAIKTLRQLSKPLVIELPDNPIELTVDCVQKNIATLTPAIIQYSRQLQFVNHLMTHANEKLAIEYHLARLIRFLKEIPKNQLLQSMQALPEPEVRALRNLIQHDGHDVDLAGVSIEGVICHYLPAITKVLPGLLASLQNAPVHQPVQAGYNFSFRNTALGLFGVAAAIGAAYCFKENLGALFPRR